MDKIYNILGEMSDYESHYLIKARRNSNHYFDEFIEAAKILEDVLSEKEFESWYTHKMQLRQQNFFEKTFIQLAVETSAVRYFAEHFNEDFAVEKKINDTNEKDVDIQFSNCGFIYNVEVKCSDFQSKEEIDVTDSFKYESFGRYPNYNEDIEMLAALIDEGRANLGEQTKPHLITKKMDNNLKDFLELSHEKFNTDSNENEVNILLVGCDDVSDIQKWYSYLFASQGLFTDNSFTKKDNYNNVDIVVFTNLYFKQNKFFDKKVRNSWSLENSFNLVFSNPFRKLSKEKAMKNFINIFPHSTSELSTYSVPGDVPIYVKDIFRIPYFVRDYLERDRGIYLFEEK